MIYLFSIYFFLSKNKSKIHLFLLLFIILTLGLGILIGKVPELNDFVDVVNILITFILLSLIIDGFKPYKGIKWIEPIKNTRNFKLLFNVLILLGLFAFLINVFITFKSFGVLTTGTNITKFKNDGGASDFLTQTVGAPVLFISRFLSPLVYFALGIHFFFLTKSEKVKSFIFLLVALNIPLLGFHALSRSAAIQFLLMYLAYFIYTYPALNKKLRRGMLLYGALLFVSSFTLLNLITESRFSEYYNVPFESKIKDPVIYSTLDYGAQWNKNGIEVLSEYNVDKIMYGKSTFPLYSFIQTKLGFEVESLSDSRYRNLGEKYDGTFNGPVATLIYDLGYVFAFVFVLLFRKIVVLAAPKNTSVDLMNFISFGLLIPFPLMFFTNNVYSYVSINMAIIYFVIAKKLLKVKKS